MDEENHSCELVSHHRPGKVDSLFPSFPFFLSTDSNLFGGGGGGVRDRERSGICLFMFYNCLYLATII